MRRALALALLMALVAPAALPAGAAPVTLQDYVARLDVMRIALHERRVADAQGEAKALMGAAVASPAGNFAADDSLLEAVATNRLGAEGRLEVALRELRKVAPRATAAVDRKLLERLRREEEAGALKAGGEVAQPPISNEPLLERMAEVAGNILQWIADKLVMLRDWLSQFWPSSPISKSGSTGSPRGMVAALVVAIVAVLSLLVWEVLRRSRGGVAEPATASDPIASARDEDPLSRGANEWERYAMQLAAAGRIREAIRAWYHAVLVTCYGAGLLHFRKGRTNWEYVAAVSPELPWRGDFIALTRRFETEWYGRTTSTAEALDECAGRAEQILEDIRNGVAA
jgi:hypothetical protein